MTFGERLLDCMRKAGYNQKQLAEKLGITPVRLNYWIKDKRQPDIPWIKKLATALDVSSDYLIGNSTEAPSNAMDALVEERNLSAADRNLLEGILSLTPEQREALTAFASSLVDAARKESKEIDTADQEKC